MAEEKSNAPPMFDVQIDGVWHQFPKGTRVIEACAQAGVYVPRYCYHKKLSAPGNCRMCLIEMGMPRMGPERKPELGADGKPIINWMPRPQICCAQDVAEGMGVRTSSPLVEECRKGVMEFLLINHPLDCPICDQAGECELQEFSVEYGAADSRFLENKVKKPKAVQLGPRVTLDDERCILCSRCVRFCNEIAKDDVLGFIDRGSHTVLTAHPGTRLENDDVNACWMCDYGRLNFKYLEAENRLLEPQIFNGKELMPVDWKSAIANAALQLRQFSGANIAIIASGRMTNEELWLTRKIADLLGVGYIDIVPRFDEGDDILLSEDRNPNATGAHLILRLNSEPGAKLPAIAKAVKSGEIRLLLALGENPIKIGITAEQLTNMPALVAMDILSNAANEHATVLLPASGFAEKRGSMINGEGRLQRLNRAVRPPGNARDDWEILRDLLQALGGSNGIYTIEDVFRQISTEIPQFAGITLSKIGDLGVQVLEKNESPRPPVDPKAKDIEQAEAKRPAGRT